MDDDAPAEPSADGSDGDGVNETAAPGHPHGLSRRGLIGLLGGGAAALAAGGAAGAALASRSRGEAGADDLAYDFHGEHQAGIVTPAQDRMHFASFAVREGTTREELVELLQDWTYAASRLALGVEISVAGAFGGGPYLPPEDTGEAADLGAAGLTLTFGFGKSLFQTEDGEDRFGLASQLPSHFTDLPTMVNDFIQPARSGGDLCIQACANDPQVAVHAIRNLTRIGFGRTTLLWSQLGFGRTSSTSTAQVTPRNLFGQKDGTNNLKTEDPDGLADHLWIGAEQGPDWAVGGAYLVARRISMTIEVWDGVRLEEQERVTGRDKREGAPLSGGTEFTDPDFSATDESGRLLIDERSHVARVHPDQNDGIAMLRRGYNFVDGNDDHGRLDAGLFFIAFVNAPERFAQVHKNMARDDLFVEYLKTTSSSTFLVPPGVRDGQHVGHQLFEA